MVAIGHQGRLRGIDSNGASGKAEHLRPHHQGASADADTRYGDRYDDTYGDCDISTHGDTAARRATYFGSHSEAHYCTDTDKHPDIGAHRDGYTHTDSDFGSDTYASANFDANPRANAITDGDCSSADIYVTADAYCDAFTNSHGNTGAANTNANTSDCYAGATHGNTRAANTDANTSDCYAGATHAHAGATHASARQRPHCLSLCSSQQ